MSLYVVVRWYSHKNDVCDSARVRRVTHTKCRRFLGRNLTPNSFSSVSFICIIGQRLFNLVLNLFSYHLCIFACLDRNRMFFRASKELKLPKKDSHTHPFPFSTLKFKSRMEFYFFECLWFIRVQLTSEKK